MKYETRTTQLTDQPNTTIPLNREASTSIEILDQAGGEFVEVKQLTIGAIRIDPEEWPDVRAAIDQMISNCKPTL